MFDLSKEKFAQIEYVKVVNLFDSSNKIKKESCCHNSYDKFELSRYMIGLYYIFIILCCTAYRA